MSLKITDQEKIEQIKKLRDDLRKKGVVDFHITMAPGQSVKHACDEMRAIMELDVNTLPDFKDEF